MSRKIAIILTPSETPFYDPRYFHFSNLPLSLGILQSYLRARGYTVSSTDLNTHMARFANAPEARQWLPLYDKDLILQHLLQDAPTGMEDLLDNLLRETEAACSDIVGISTGTNMSFFEIHMAFLLGRRIREQMGKPVVLGGANLDYLWQFREAFQELWAAVFRKFEYLFIGPGERSFADLIAGLDQPEGLRHFRELPGAVYYENGQVIRNLEDTPTLIRPDFRGLALEHYTLCTRAGQHLSESMEMNLIHFYKWPIAQGLAISEMNRRRLSIEDRKENLFIPYIFNYHCPYQCAFCVQSREDKPSLAAKDAQSVVDDIEALTTEYNTEYVHFFNNAFNLSPSFVREFCNLVRERGLRFYWSDCARFNNLNEEMVDLLYRAGCRKLIFGLDTGSEKILKLIDKRLDLEQARRVLRWCHERGIWAELEVIVGLPYEKEEDFQATYAFVKENIDKRYITWFHVNRYFVIPCSLLGRRSEHYGIRIHRSPDGYDKILKRSAETLVALTAPQSNAKSIPAPPYHIWRYSELTGRPVDQIIEETEGKFRRMMELSRRLVPNAEMPLASQGKGVKTALTCHEIGGVNR